MEELENENVNVVETGAFLTSLKRNNAQIRKDRAASISDVAQLKYRRAVEDLELTIKDMKRDQENMLDLSPTVATSLMVASDFDADRYVSKDLELGVRIRNAEIQLEIAKARYRHLFGGTI